MSDFVSFARGLGVLINGTPPQGVWRRFPTRDKPRNKNASVKFMGDHGFVQDWASMDEPAVWVEHAGITPTILKQRSRESMLAERRQQVIARERMSEEFRSFRTLRDGHPYLERKGLSVRGCSRVRVNDDLLVVPMYRAGELASYQTIAADGTKKFRYGCSPRGARFELELDRDCTPVVTMFCEGFATGLALYQLHAKARVIVCFNAGNLVEVAQRIRVSGPRVVCADNDWETALKPHMNGVNPGLQKAQEAADALGCGVAYPSDIKGSDWADARQEWGESKCSFRLRMAVMKEARNP